MARIKLSVSSVLIWLLIVFNIVGIAVGCGISSDVEKSSSLTKTDVAIPVSYIEEELARYETLLADMKEETLSGIENSFERWRINSKNEAVQKCFEYIEKVDKSKNYTEEEISEIRQELSELYSTCRYFEPIDSEEETFNGALGIVISGLEERLWYYNTGNEAYTKMFPVKEEAVTSAVNELKALRNDLRFSKISVDRAKEEFNLISDNLKSEDAETFEAILSSIDFVINGYEQNKQRHFSEKLEALLAKMQERIEKLDIKIHAHENFSDRLSVEEFSDLIHLQSLYSSMRLQLKELLENLDNGRLSFREALTEYKSCIDGTECKYVNYDSMLLFENFTEEFYYDLQFVIAYC